MKKLILFLLVSATFYGQNSSRLDSISVSKIKLTTTPTASTGAYSFLTYNSTTDEVEQVASTVLNQVSQSITDGVTAFAPSENVVYDALQLKANLNTPTFTGQVDFDGGARMNGTNIFFNTGGTGLIDGNTGAFIKTAFPSVGWYSNERFTAPVVRTTGYTFSTLPAGTQGDTAFITDALTPTYLAPASGGGSVVCPVFYNGTAWVYH